MVSNPPCPLLWVPATMFIPLRGLLKAIVILRSAATESLRPLKTTKPALDRHAHMCYCLPMPVTAYHKTVSPAQTRLPTLHRGIHPRVTFVSHPVTSKSLLANSGNSTSHFPDPTQSWKLQNVTQSYAFRGNPPPVHLLHNRPSASIFARSRLMPASTQSRSAAFPKLTWDSFGTV